jgi:Zn-dependent protease
MVRFVADNTDMPVVPPSLPVPGQGQPDNTGAKWTISGLFLGLVAVLLGLAAVMVVLPGYARLEVFPFVLAGWLISLCLHEFGHAIAAYVSGDCSVRDKGYLTLDPLRYTDLQFSIVWPLVFLAIGGIGLPGGAVYVNKGALRSPVHRALVSAAGPLATLAVLIGLLAVMHAAGSAPAAAPSLYAALAFLAFLQLTALVLTSLPIPGLDGWGIIEPLLPSALREFGARVAGIAPTLLFLLLLLVPPVNTMFWRLVFNLCRMTGLGTEWPMRGLFLFQFWR